jgi:hypothetical protein
MTATAAIAYLFIRLRRLIVSPPATLIPERRRRAPLAVESLI